MNEMQVKRTPELIGAEIRSLTTQARCITLWYGIEIGRRLTEAKEMVGHGEWLPFLEQQTEFSQPTASRFMRLYKEYGADQNSLFGAESKYSTLNNLSVSAALKLLAVPEDEREQFAAENDIEHKSAREVDELIKQKAELERKLEEKARELQEADEGHALALADAKADYDNARAELNTTVGQLKTARERIRELEARPVEVAVERDEAAITAAKEEEKAKADKAIEKLKKEHDKKLRAEIEKSVAAKEELETLKAALADKSNENEKQALEQQIKALEARLSMAAPEVSVFQAAFQRVQQEFNLMLDAMGKAPEGTKEKLSAAANAMVQSFAERLRV